jgi:hypothetical protein
MTRWMRLTNHFIEFLNMQNMQNMVNNWKCAIYAWYEKCTCWSPNTAPMEWRVCLALLAWELLNALTLLDILPKLCTIEKNCLMVYGRLYTVQRCYGSSPIRVFHDGHCHENRPFFSEISGFFQKIWLCATFVENFWKSLFFRKLSKIEILPLGAGHVRLII